MTIKEQLIRELEQAPEASLMQFMQIWQFAKQPSTYQAKLTNTKISDFFSSITTCRSCC